MMYSKKEFTGILNGLADRGAGELHVEVSPRQGPNSEIIMDMYLHAGEFDDGRTLSDHMEEVADGLGIMGFAVINRLSCPPDTRGLFLGSWTTFNVLVFEIIRYWFMEGKYERWLHKWAVNYIGNVKIHRTEKELSDE